MRVHSFVQKKIKLQIGSRVRETLSTGAGLPTAALNYSMYNITLMYVDRDSTVSFSLCSRQTLMTLRGRARVRAPAQGKL